MFDSPGLNLAQDEAWIEVLIDCPGSDTNLFTYAMPLDQRIAPGDIVSVPFGTQQVGGIAIRLVTTLPTGLSAQQVKRVEAVITQTFFPPLYWDLLHRVAHYYCVPVVQVVRVALPPGLLGRSQRRIRLTALGDAAELDQGLQPTAQELYKLLRSQKSGDYSWKYLQQQVPQANKGLRELLQRGWVESYLAPPETVRPKLRQAVILTGEPTVLGAQSATPLTPRQQEVLEVLKRQGGEVWLSDLLQRCQTSSSLLKTLAQKGWLQLEPREVLRQEQSQAVLADHPKPLTPAQAQALSVLTALQGAVQALLHGVTGSGKTEVYLQAIAPVLQRGLSVLVLVPEIGLTPQLTDRFRARFGNRVSVYHSALAEGERYDTWRLFLSGQPLIVIGTRSAIFAPLPKLGLIILDEEHDGSFKQDHPAPCYHARKVAQWRSQLSQCPLILGSATPSLETWLETSNQHSSQFSHQFRYLALPERIYSRPLPPVEIIDMRQELREGNRSILSRALFAALAALPARQEQGILFIHRRGHSTFVSCRSCGEAIKCPNCDVSLAYHQPHAQHQPLLRCHYCNWVQSQPQVCPSCTSPYLKQFGSGTQKVVQELAQSLPQLRCLRFDSDTTRTKGAHRALLDRFAGGEVDVLVGTQMLTKGIDLPQVTLVGILAADGLLHLSDYRASERAAQTLTQVAGRAGRGAEPGRVLLQTYSPDHPVVQLAAQHNYVGFLQAELNQRQDLHYPPYGQLILLRLSSPDAVAVQSTAEALAALLAPKVAGAYQILGPAPAQVMRVARRFRWQILLKRLPQVNSQLWAVDPQWLRSHCPSQVSLTIDVDPLNPL